MSTLVVDRMSAVSPPELQARARVVLAGVAHRRLGDALRLSPLPDGDWFIRRLDVAVPFDPTRPDPSVEVVWADAVITALHATLRIGSPDVVHYRHRLDGLVDLVVSLAAGDVERAWAWHRAGLVVDADLAQLADRAAAVGTALRRSPESALAVLVRSLDMVGLARLHRLLGASGWADAAELVALALGVKVTVERATYADNRRTPTAGTDSIAPTSPLVPAAEDRLVERVSAALASSRLAAAFLGGVIRPDEHLAAAWAVLALAETDPTVLKRADADTVIELAAALLRGGPDRDRSADHVRGGEDLPTGATDEAPAEPASWPTVWAGLLFLLATAADAGVPDVLSDDPVLVERPLSWCLHQIATRLVPVADDDPAVLVFAGLPVDESPRPTARPPLDEEGARLDEVSRRWADATAARLDREGDENAFEVVREVALRRGGISWEPGWVDVHLRLDDVDVDIRRAGLDLDPGWVPWLGTVVRFVHG